MKKVVFGLLAGFAAASVFADATGESAYLYGALGNAQLYSSSLPEMNGVPEDILAFKVKRDAVGYKLQLGYQIDSFWAVEGGYINFGKHSVSPTGMLAPHISTNANMKVDGFNLNLVGRFPVSDGFSIYAKLGGLWSNMRTRLDLQDVKVQIESKVNKLVPFGGVGARYDVDAHSSVRLDYDIAGKVGKKGYGKATPALLSLGYQYTF